MTQMQHRLRKYSDSDCVRWALVAPLMGVPICQSSKPDRMVQVSCKVTATSYGDTNKSTRFLEGPKASATFVWR